MPSEDPDGGCLQLPGSVWVAWLLAAGPWGTGTITEAEPQGVLGRLSCEDTVRPRGGRSLEAEEETGLAPGASTQPQPWNTWLHGLWFSFYTTRDS